MYNSDQKNIFEENENYIIRLIEHSDYEKGFFELLSQLTDAPKLNKKTFIEIIQLNNRNSFIIVIEDKKEKKLIGTVKIFFEYKFIRNGGKVGHFEDLVIHIDYRKKGLGSILTKLLIKIAAEEKCYKLIGNTSDNFKGFYEINGFDNSGISFKKYFI